ncbi:hypothetical protein BD410DRAFT_843961 [Rickenella mellea]|uniref:NYN domain-containing protein n=1 Tax=Rickenella mellea TaxID=50990 RepID=A0A4Y7PPI1_9AGAM|nr:hypothetical protein BD410DRAFT_843961 [Rickenella mellea]
MMLVDMLSHAIDKPSPTSIVVISGNHDFTYGISNLRLRGYNIIAITPPSAHPHINSQASAALNWNSDIIDALYGVDDEDKSDPRAPPPKLPHSTLEKAPMVRVGSSRNDATLCPRCVQGQGSQSPPQAGALNSHSVEASKTLADLTESKRPVLDDSRDVLSTLAPLENSGNGVDQSMSIEDNARPERFPTSEAVPKDESIANVTQPKLNPSTSLVDDSMATPGLYFGTVPPNEIPIEPNLNPPDGFPSPWKHGFPTVVVGRDIRDVDSRKFEDEPAKMEFRIANEEENTAATGIPKMFPTTADDRIFTMYYDDNSTDAGVIVSKSEASCASNPSPTFSGGPSSHPLSSVETDDTPISNASDSSPPAVPAHIPEQLLPLVLILTRLHANGTDKPLWSQVGAELRNIDPLVYKKAGLTKMKQYLEMAETAGIVKLGNTYSLGREWVQLAQSKSNETATVERLSGVPVDDAGDTFMVVSRVSGESNTPCYPSSSHGVKNPCNTMPPSRSELESTNNEAAHLDTGESYHTTEELSYGVTHIKGSKEDIHRSPSPDTSDGVSSAGCPPSPPAPQPVNIEQACYAEHLPRQPGDVADDGQRLVEPVRSQSSSAPEIVEHLPETFASLISVLSDLKGKGIKLACWSQVGTAHRQFDAEVYSRVGVSELREYLELAERAGVVLVGGREYLNREWVQINPKSPFMPVVDFLAKRLKEGVRFVLRSVLGERLPKDYPGIYAKAGVPSLAKYLEKAEAQGYIKSGSGSSVGSKWISLPSL